MEQPAVTVKRARCPQCGSLEGGLTIQNGRLLAGTVAVTGYVCSKCGKTVHWGARGAAGPMRIK